MRAHTHTIRVAPVFQVCNTFLGTVTYMSPERINNEQYSFSADIWSLVSVLPEQQLLVLVMVMVLLHVRMYVYAFAGEFVCCTRQN